MVETNTAGTVTEPAAAKPVAPVRKRPPRTPQGRRPAKAAAAPEPAASSLIVREPGKLPGIRIEADPVAKIPVNLVGVEYLIQPLKAVTVMTAAHESRERFAAAGVAPETVMDPNTPEGQALYLLSMEMRMQETHAWVDRLFSADDADAVIARLDDPADALDADHIDKLVEALMELVGGDPTG